jgi:cyclophilin family peptidyl-prolyl cis-trans isomerase/HEAT repeat protein
VREPRPAARLLCPTGAEARLRRPSRTLLPLAALPLLVAAAPRQPSRVEKLARILSFEDRRTLGGGELDRYLRDPDRSVRRRAALAAGRIGEPALVPTLVELMNDNEPEVRQMAAFGLGLIGDRLAVERLLAALKDSDSLVRARSAEALGRIGDVRAAAEVSRMVIAALPKADAALAIRGDDPGSTTDPWLEPRLGLLALARLKDRAAAEAALLLGGKPRFDWWAATYAAMRVESPSLKPVLLAAAGSSDALSRALAARGLGALKDAGAADTLAQLARDPDEQVAASALRALAALGGPQAGAAVGALPPPARDAVALEWLRAVAALPPDARLRSRVASYVGDPAPWLRAAGLRALAHIDREEFALVLSSLDPDPEWSVRAALARALGESGGEVNASILLGMLKDDDVRVLPAVLEELRAARGADALDTLRRHLEHPDYAVRAAAAEGITALKAAGQGEALAAAYRRSLADGELEARLALVAALAAQKDAAALEALRAAAAGDPARVVRTRASAALEALGQQAPAPGPEAYERPFHDYRQAMAPFVPLPDVPLYTPRLILHTRHGRIDIHLNVVEAPLASASFVSLARRGFFDGLGFPRVEPGFVVQGGSPRGDQEGGPGYTLRCEIGQRPYGRGTVGVALAGKDTGGSQFFITLAPTPQLDGAYTVLGWVAAGMDVVDKLRPGDRIERAEVWSGG